MAIIVRVDATVEEEEGDGKSSVQLGECRHVVAFVKRREREAAGVESGRERR